ncbi:unnamed protein product [Owenia fusiformis]|uniref:Uncharacterized protein n=1 Tax=Owenia fusiformis TaxID=6347 RepID=A0A8J1TVK0_OWEFU|nr:unnamed protein product [Owenia fusiformis]
MLQIAPSADEMEQSKHIDSLSNENSKIDLTYIAQSCHKLLSQYQWLTNAYMSDFFTNDLWDELNPKWSKVLNDRDPKELTCFINNTFMECDPRKKDIWPLSLLSFKAATQCYSLPRTPIKTESLFNNSQTNDPNGLSKNDKEEKGAILNGQYLKLEHSFRRHVKPKKQHEIHRLSKLIHNICKSVDCDNVVDVGAGQGHLSRLLTFGYGLKVTTVESASSHAPKAQQFDKEVQQDIKKKNGKISNKNDQDVCNDQQNDLPNHIVHYIEPSVDPSSFAKSLNLDSSGHFVLTGLHSCGDLIPTMLRLFVNCPSAKAIAVVGCCYMKMTLSSDVGFPLSSYVKRLNPVLTWETAELACHSIDSYAAQLKDGTGDVKFQSYRAVLQTIIEKRNPDATAKLRCTKNKSFKKNKNLVNYITSRLEHLGLDANLTDSDLETVESLSAKWRNYGAFNMLRLSLGPVVETFILIDRVLFLKEHGLQCHIIPLFDSQLSPRNLALVAYK